jgi:anti-sigma B factor antagonist
VRPEFSIAESTEPTTVRLAVKGEMDLHVVDRLRRVVEKHLAEPTSARSPRGITIDLTDVTFLDSSGIGMLLTCKRLAQAAGRSYDVVGANGLTAQILTLTGVAAYLAGGF